MATGRYILKERSRALITTIMDNEYTKVRRFYAWVGFWTVVLVIIAILATLVTWLVAANACINSLN